MSEFEISLSEINQAIYELEQYRQSISSAADQLDCLKNSLEVSNLSILTVRSRLAVTAEQLYQESRKLAHYAENLKSAEQRYMQAESHIISSKAGLITGTLTMNAVPMRAAAVNAAAQLLPDLDGKADFKKSYSTEYYKYSENFGPMDVSAEVGSAELNAKAHAALFNKKGEFDPCISAAVGASISAASAEVGASIGNDIMGISGSASAELLGADAKGTLKAGILDKHGNFAPTLKAEGKLQAVAAEATGQISGNVLGLSADVHGSVNIGIGAHANIGLDAGVLSCDIGASFGIGASAGFSIDIKGAVDTMLSGAEAVYDYTKKLF